LSIPTRKLRTDASFVSIRSKRVFEKRRCSKLPRKEIRKSRRVTKRASVFGSVGLSRKELRNCNLGMKCEKSIKIKTPFLKVPLARALAANCPHDVSRSLSLNRI
jgi:hypothetical protein